MVITYEKGERAFDNLLEELGYSFVYYQPSIYDDEGCPIDVEERVDEILLYNGKEYLLSHDSKDKPVINKLREEVIAYTEFKLQQIIREHTAKKEGE